MPTNRQLGDAVEGSPAVGGDPEFSFQIECASAARQLDDLRDIINGFEGSAAVIALDQARNVLIEHGFAQAGWNEIDKLVAAQNPGNIFIVKDVLGSRKAQSRARDDGWGGNRGAIFAAMHLPATLENVGEVAAEFGVVIAGRRVGWRRQVDCVGSRHRDGLRRLGRCGSGGNGCRRFFWRDCGRPPAQSSRIKPAQRLIE